jgi:HK97 family phage major capsid protein
MPNRLLERLGADYDQLVGQYETILNRCADEQRDPNENEVGLIEGLRSNMTPLAERIMELRAIDDQRMNTATALTEIPDLGALSETRSGHAVVSVRSEELVYRSGVDASSAERLSFFRDLLHAQQNGDTEARSRLDRHNLQMRAAGTTASGTGVVPPTWMFNEFAIIAHGARPWADTLRRVAITDANPIVIGKQATPGAVIGLQGGENSAPSDGNFNASQITISPSTYTGKVDVSRQLLDGSNPAVDGLVFTDCMGAYNEQVETAVVAAFTNATGFAATITFPGTAPVYANMFDAFIDAGASVRKHRKSAPKVVFCSEGAWAFMAKEKDSQGRPLVTTGYHGPVNAYGLGDAVVYGQVAGEVVGLQVVPSWAGVDNSLYVLKADDSLLLESSTFNFRYEEVLGPESIRLGVWGYAAPVISRYPSGIAFINAGSTIPAPQEAEEAETQPAVGGGDALEPGDGPGTPKARRR